MSSFEALNTVLWSVSPTDLVISFILSLSTVVITYWWCAIHNVVAEFHCFGGFILFQCTLWLALQVPSMETILNPKSCAILSAPLTQPNFETTGRQQLLVRWTTPWSSWGSSFPRLARYSQWDVYNGGGFGTIRCKKHELLRGRGCSTDQNISTSWQYFQRLMLIAPNSMGQSFYVYKL